MKKLITISAILLSLLSFAQYERNKTNFKNIPFEYYKVDNNTTHVLYNSNKDTITITLKFYNQKEFYKYYIHFNGTNNEIISKTTQFSDYQNVINQITKNIVTAKIIDSNSKLILSNRINFISQHNSYLRTLLDKKEITINKHFINLKLYRYIHSLNSLPTKKIEATIQKETISHFLDDNCKTIHLDSLTYKIHNGFSIIDKITNNSENNYTYKITQVLINNNGTPLKTKISSNKKTITLPKDKAIPSNLITDYEAQLEFGRKHLEETLRKHIYSNGKIKEEFKNSGTMHIVFSIYKNGTSDVTINCQLPPEATRELSNSLKTNIKWIPAIENGKPIDTKVNYPFLFR